MLDGEDGGTSWWDSLVCAAALSSISLYCRCQEKQSFSWTFCGWVSPGLRAGLQARRKMGKAPAMAEHCPSQTWIGCYLPFWVGASSPTTAMNRGNCFKVPILRAALFSLFSKTHWLPKSFPVADWEADCIFPHFPSWWPGVMCFT